MAKVEVQIRHCLCCGLQIGSVFVALYTLFLYALLAGLAIWALSDAANGNDSQVRKSCLRMHFKHKERSMLVKDRKITFHPAAQTTIVIEDSTTYHCSFGLYTEELKYASGFRYINLLFDIILYSLLVLASVVLLIGLCAYNQWFLIPWIFLMAIDIIRGFISVIVIFVYSHGYLARIATGIFFLGLQCLHISLLLIIVAKFQRIHNRKNGLSVDDRYDPRVYPSTTLPSNYYSPQTRHHDPYPYSDYSPSQKDSRYYDSTYGTHHPAGPRY
ncbi:Protein C18D11 [Aphelenchoides bicaudatus]|nr:Protein C18D11 [Aphelenchoides bicaudatus]